VKTPTPGPRRIVPGVARGKGKLNDRQAAEFRIYSAAFLPTETDPFPRFRRRFATSLWGYATASSRTRTGV
jgi:hypothetical protein